MLLELVTDSNHPSFKDETGKIYGKFTVLRRVENRGTAAAWLCRCECGTEKNVGIGAFDDDVRKLQNVISYLKRFEV